MRTAAAPRGRVLVVPALLTLAAAFGGALVVWPEAFAGDPALDALVTEVRTQPAHHRKLMALEQISRIGSRPARSAVEALAGSADDATALAAISTMSREDQSGFRTALEDIVDDTDRSEAVRCAALGACLKLRKDDARSWSDVKGWVETRTRSDAALAAFARSYAKSAWGSEVSDE